jgi:uncharacterized protein
MKLPGGQRWWGRLMRLLGRAEQPAFIVLGRRRRRWIAYGVATVLGLYVLACVGLVVFERQITFQPDPRHTTPQAARLDRVAEQVLRTPDGERLVVWRAQAAPGKPTILYFHGNGEALTYRAGRVAAFMAEGWGVYMMAYRGYAGSTGRPSEAAIVADAMRAHEALVGEGVPPRQIIVYGESLGTHVALRVALAKEARALVLEAPFTSMLDEWRRFAPIMPVGLLLRDRFESLPIIGRLAVPVLVLHGRRDRLVPFKFGERLFAAAPQPKRLEIFPDASHTELYGYNAIAAVRQFVSDVERGTLAR